MGNNLTQHQQEQNDIENALVQFNAKVEEIAHQLQEQGITEDQFCQKYVLVYKNRLKRFNQRVLSNAAYELRLAYPNGNKDRLCQIILEHYRKKLRIVNKIINAMNDSNCYNAERVISTNLHTYTRGKDPKIIHDINEEYFELTNTVKILFEDLNRYLDEILRIDISDPELDRLIRGADQRLEEGLMRCCEQESKLKDLAWHVVGNDQYENMVTGNIPCREKIRDVLNNPNINKAR